ncbi:subclass B1 metallo-beta-lactamase [Brevibacillus sp. DP1.3A]|uniref:subclass B1 metallo-beta-lactamase n=1 Tax=unclassified Brevibacillus TaxID=2684853 RepID=UPI00156BA0D0|nr:subclass B1 metallo-beta-lactamase [Brevibacillus sp. DP1.3A]UED73955.1 subclass B1 metallo-beta-lactamase [Brevibacillus sp. DP1.3A]
MKNHKGWIGKAVCSLFLTVAVTLTSFSNQTTIAQVTTSTPTQITNPGKSIVLTKLNDKVWLHTSYNEWNGTTYDHNGLIVSTSKGVVLIDTAWGDTQKTEELLQMIKKHWKKDVVLALITHAHDDSISGIRALLHQKIDVRSTRLTAKLAKEYGYPSPNPTLDEKPVIKVGDTILEAYYPGEGHSSDNITVWLPQSKILFGGCFVKSLDAKDLGNLSDANVEQWDDSVQKVIEKYPQVETVVPGHGNTGGKNLLDHTIELIKQHSQKQEAALK